MTRAEAMRKLVQLFGRNGRYRIGKRRSSPERRAVALARMEELKQQIQPLAAEYERCGRESDYYQFWVGKTDGVLTLQQAKGDSWDDVLAQLETKRKA
jgi:hypothetical protein